MSRTGPRLSSPGALEATRAAVVSVDLGPASAQRGAPGQERVGATARRIQAIEMRLSGMTYQAIADSLGYSDPSDARSLIMRAIDRVEARQVDELRDLEGARLDRMTRIVWAILADRDQTSENRMKAVDRALRISERRARLYGLDAPVRVSVSSGAMAELEDALAALAEVVEGEVVPGDDDSSPRTALTGP